METSINVWILFFRVWLFCTFFFVCAWSSKMRKNVKKCLASSFILQPFACQFAMFLEHSGFSFPGTWQIGTEMKWKCKMKLDICSHFWTWHTHKKKCKTNQTRKNNKYILTHFWTINLLTAVCAGKLASFYTYMP